MGTQVSFHTLAVINNAAMNIVVHISLQISDFIFFGKMPKVDMLDHMVVLVLIF